MTADTRNVIKIATGLAVIAAVVAMRGLVPEMYRYLRIRRM